MPLLEHQGHQRFKNILFDCLDEGQAQLVGYFIDSGFNPNVSKQVKDKDDDGFKVKSSHLDTGLQALHHLARLSPASHCIPDPSQFCGKHTMQQSVRHIALAV